MAITARPTATQPPSRERLMAQRVLELLREELAALESGDAEALGTLAKAKERAVGELHAAVSEPGGVASLRDPEFGRSMKSIVAANAVNGRHVAARLAYTRTRLGGLTNAVQMARAATDTASMYQADGFAGGLRRSSGLFGSA